LRWVVATAILAALAVPSFASADPLVRPRPVAATGPACAVQLQVANPSPGDTNLPRSLVMSGSAADRTAPSGSGSGIAQVQAFLGNRDEGGMLLGTATLAPAVFGEPGAWTLTATFPGDISGGATIFVYALSAVSGQEAIVSVPVIVGRSAPAGGFPPPTTAGVACPGLALPGNIVPPVTASTLGD
jgi:hypothetical protein